jgi:type IV secretory pathway VirB2 component (pilin)
MIPMNPSLYAQAPNQGSALAASVEWVASVLTGTIGTSVAVLAMAGVGLAMLQGRLSVRDALRVVLGCFILFGAPAIAQSLLGMGQNRSAPVAIPTPPPAPAFAPPPTAKPRADPYAGASVPM